jgi:hypothetical protein
LTAHPGRGKYFYGAVIGLKEKLIPKLGIRAGRQTSSLHMLSSELHMLSSELHMLYVKEDCLQDTGDKVDTWR